MPETGEGSPISSGDKQVSAERVDQGQRDVPQQEVSSERGLSRFTSILKSIAQTIRGKHEQSGVLDPNKINPFSTQKPKPPEKFPPGQPSTS